MCLRPHRARSIAEAAPNSWGWIARANDMVGAGSSSGKGSLGGIQAHRRRGVRAGGFKIIDQALDEDWQDIAGRSRIQIGLPHVPAP